jgi:two-component system, response regulator PdtaR
MQQIRPGESNRILLVEDDDLLRDILNDILCEAGFRTSEACCADEALSLLEDSGFAEATAALVTDIDMPGTLDGLALANCVHERWPRMGVVVTSGAHCGAGLLIRAPAVFLPKPFRGERLIEAVHAVIEGEFAVPAHRWAS